LKNVTGVIVVSVDKGSEADDAGIKPEDIIVSLNGEKISSDSDFWGYIVDAPPGTKVKAKILRNGDEIEKEFEVKTK
jgi:serine protease Do